MYLFQLNDPKYNHVLRFRLFNRCISNIFCLCYRLDFSVKAQVFVLGFHFGPYSDWPESQGWAETELLHKGLHHLLRDDDPGVDTHVVHTKQDLFFLISIKKIQLGQTKISKKPKPCNYIPHPSASINCGKNIVIPLFPHKSPSFPSWPVARLMISNKN